MHRSNRQTKFGLLDRSAEIQIKERNLPHWFQLGAATFITFRTADSLPKEVLVRWQGELEEWLQSRQLPFELASSTVQQRLPQHEALLARLNDQESRHFKKLSDRIFHRSLDECHGACLLRRSELARIVADALFFHCGSKYELDCFVIMPNHVHTIVQFVGTGCMKTVSQSWLRYTARQINVACGRTGVFWQAEPFDHIIRSPEQFSYLRNYIADNPAKANLCAEDFVLWQGEPAVE